MLPIALLGTRAAWNEDLEATLTNLVHGDLIGLPGKFLVPSLRYGLTPSNIAERLRNYFADLAPQPVVRQRKTFISKKLVTRSHVFLRRDALHYVFTSPYEGPHRVNSRLEKHLFADVIGENNTV